MSTENSFNLGNIEPAKVNFIDSDNNDQEEHLDGKSTPAKVEDTHAAQQAPDTAPVHAQAQDSDERYRNLQAAYTKTTQENSELRNRLEQLEMRLAQPTPQNQFAQPAPAIPAQPDELDSVADEFPELKPIASRMKKMQHDMESQKSDLEKQQEEARVNAEISAENDRMNTILSRHSDAIPLTNSVDFQGWLARQPTYMQRLIPNGPALEIIDVITSYKSSAGQQQQGNQLNEARKAGAPNNSAAPIVNNGNSEKQTWTHAQIEAMSYAEYEALEAELDLAAREGRIT